VNTPAVKFTLRDYKPGDFGTLYEIDQACYEPGIAYSKRDMRGYLQFPGAACILAETSREIAGFCMSARQGTRGYIVTIDVLEKYRKSGIGSALLCEVERRLAANGVREVGLKQQPITNPQLPSGTSTAIVPSALKKDITPAVATHLQ